MVALIPITVALIGVPQSITLRYNPAPGVKYRQRMVTTTSQAFGAQSIKSETDMRTTIRVVSNENGVVTLTSVVDNYTISSVPSNPAIGDSTKKLKGMKWQTTMDNFGNIKAVKSLTEDPMAKMVVGAMSASLTGLDFPKGPIHVGSTWKTSMDPGKALGGMPQSANIKSTGVITMSFKVVKIGPSLVDLACVMGGNMNMSMGEMKMKMVVNGTGVTSVYKSNGVTAKMNMKAGYKMNTGGQAMSQQMTINLTTQ